MSLTNPNTPVSQQDLQDFYHKLLPYMGGSFGMIANKFSKGDMYSTDEKMIGQWSDGKPLYQKVITVTLETITDGTWYAKNVALPSGLEVVFIKGAYNFNRTNVGSITLPYTNNNIDKMIKAYISNNTLYISSNWSQYSNATVYVVICYTKASDSAISIGDDTDYSTEEKIVGTWIDGKPIYQKTFIVTSGITNDNAIELQGGCDVLVGYMLNYANVPSWGVYVPEYVGRGVASSKLENLLQICPIIDYNTHKLTVTPRIGSSVSSISELAVTIQYTKTT